MSLLSDDGHRQKLERLPALRDRGELRRHLARVGADHPGLRLALRLRDREGVIKSTTWQAPVQPARPAQPGMPQASVAPGPVVAARVEGAGPGPATSEASTPAELARRLRALEDQVHLLMRAGSPPAAAMAGTPSADGTNRSPEGGEEPASGTHPPGKRSTLPNSQQVQVNPDLRAELRDAKRMVARQGERIAALLRDQTSLREEQAALIEERDALEAAAEEAEARATRYLQAFEGLLDRVPGLGPHLESVLPELAEDRDDG